MNTSRNPIVYQRELAIAWSQSIDVSNFESKLVKKIRQLKYVKDRTDEK